MKLNKLLVLVVLLALALLSACTGAEAPTTLIQVAATVQVAEKEAGGAVEQAADAACVLVSQNMALDAFLKGEPEGQMRCLKDQTLKDYCWREDGTTFSQEIFDWATGQVVQFGEEGSKPNRDRVADACRAVQ